MATRDCLSGDGLADDRRRLDDRLSGEVYDRDGNEMRAAACMSIWRRGNAISFTCVHCKARQKGFE